MISLHELHKRGGDVEKAVLAFGDLHPPGTATGPGPVPDWERAEDHWRRLLTYLLNNAAPKKKQTPEQRLRFTENSGLGLLLTWERTPGSQCPICAGLT
ncbi:hypothetical protein ACFVYP_22360 [Kitasatospora sp. NPDC058201]|uniref:hypothetical protein n=1 Tax=unclassified Kitasatospora TaxID=2633591 RepID=UPI00366201EC